MTGGRRVLALSLWAALTVALVAALRVLPLEQAAREAARAQPAWLVVAAACNLALLPLWAAEWVLLVPPPGRVAPRRMLGITAITSAVLNTVPFLAGELSALALLVTRGGLSHAAALTLLAMDQLLVGVAKLATIGAAALLAPLPGGMRGGALALVAAVAVLAVLLLLVAHGGRWAAAGPASRSAWLVRLLSVARDVDVHLGALWRSGRAWRVVALALAKKAVEVLAVLAVQRACGIELPVSSALVVVGALGISTALPLAPGNLGVYEATVFLCYRFLGVPPDRALAGAVLQHLAFLFPLVLPGWLMLARAPLRRLRPRARATEPGP